MLREADLRELVTRGEIDTVLTVFPDLYGRLVGKRINARYFCDEVLKHGMHTCNYLLACDMEMDPVPGYRFASWAEGYGDVHCVPDLNTLRRATWLERTALVLCDVYDEASDALAEVAPRTILKRQMDRAAAAGVRPMGASELEFFVLRETYESAQRKSFENLEPFGWYIEDYHILQGTKVEGLIGAIRRHLDSSGVPVEFSKGEWGPGQHEINVRYCDLLEMADRHVIYKQIAKEVALQQGLAVTFMAKLDERYAGSSMHVHSSLWSPDASRPLFAAAASAARRRSYAAARAVPLVARWAHAPRPRLHAAVRAQRELVQALPRRVVCAHRDRVVVRQPHRRLPHRRPRPVAARRMPHPGCRRQSVSGVRRHRRRRP